MTDRTNEAGSEPNVDASADPFSDESGWLTPEWMVQLLAVIEQPQLGPHARLGRTTDKLAALVDSARAELSTRVQLHVAEKSLRLQRQIAEDQQSLQARIADQADATAQQLKVASWILAIATIGLLLATIVLVVVTATHRGG